VLSTWTVCDFLNFTSKLPSKKGSFRRFPTVIICTLATLVAQNLNHQTRAALPPISTPETAPDFIVPVFEETSQVKESIASPSALVVSEFSQIPDKIAHQSLQSKAEETNPKSKIQNLKSKFSGNAHLLAASEELLAPIAFAENNIQATIGETNSQQKNALAQATGPATTEPSLDDIRGIQNQLQAVPKPSKSEPLEASPALTIVTPSGYGADNRTGFISATYQSRARYNNVSDGGVGVGVGLGDARKSVGVELSYTLASFGSSRDFGSGGFNVKVHRQLQPDLSVAAGWNGFLNVGGPNDFKNSFYGVATKIFRTRDDINLPLSRVAVTAGLGNGQFRTEDNFVEDKDSINPFGSVAVRVARPVSLIAEWTGEDLGVGASIVPFKNLNLVVTPALRDVAGAGDGARFVLGVGYAFKF
jgi:hypothetical protein